MRANTLFIDQPRLMTPSHNSGRISTRRALALGAVAYIPGWALTLRRASLVRRAAALALLAVVGLPVATQAAEVPTCGPDIKAAIVEELAAAAKLSEQDQLASRRSCTMSTPIAPRIRLPFPTASWWPPDSAAPESATLAASTTRR